MYPDIFRRYNEETKVITVKYNYSDSITDTNDCVCYFDRNWVGGTASLLTTSDFCAQSIHEKISL